ncbi:S9 family peptidase [Microlunatus speluncae]|uniref:S9 family peptidase n=1 Tax=Microlunatus speluncae TaxID=2594267 RepID=UPI0012662AF6|nr:S9 family peptidase [Microlunatus speluncae]
MTDQLARAATAPVAAPRPIIRSHHGDDFADPYEWLRDKENPEVISYLEAENEYTESRTEHLAELREAIFTDIKSRTKETDLSVPSLRRHTDGTGQVSGYWYYTRTVEGSEYAIHCRVAAVDPATPPDPERPIDGEQVLLDGNLEAGDAEFFSVGAFSVSPDGTLLAYSTDLSGDERFTIKIKNLTTGELLADQIEDTVYGVRWAGAEHLFYTKADAAWRPYLVRRHRLGTDPAADVDVFSEPDEKYWVGVESSRDDRWILIGVGSKLTTEYLILDATTPEATPRSLAPRRQGVEYNVEVAGDRLLILHNDPERDGGADFALAEAPLDATEPGQWRTVLAHEPGVRLTDVSAYAGHVVLGLRRDGLTGLRLLPRDDSGALGAGSDIELDEPLYTIDHVPGRDYDTATVRYTFTSLVTPDSVVDLDVASGERTLRKRVEVLDHPEHGRYRSEDYVQVREWATAADGTEIPISIVHRAGLELDGSAPALIYGYGSYEISIDPSFRVSQLSLLERGFVYAIAHVRGGGELGRAWYENGKELTKKNTFTDFVACAEHLISRGYTSPERLAARGGSAGGLLMGAVANLAPRTFRAIHAAVPFVDALTTILDPELPLTVTEWEEWGDPLHDPEVYAYMRSYSPYENVSAQAYPAILATTSLNDTRVFYVEPAKWVAALRRVAGNAADRPILLKTEMTAGHGGVSGRYNSWRELAFEYAWLIDQVS